MLLLRFSDISSAGRFDKELLTDQMRMELFFTPDDFGPSREVLGGDPNDACSWDFTYCSGTSVTAIKWAWRDKQLAGSIDFTVMPQTLTKLFLGFQNLYGDINTRELPRDLQQIFIGSCLFTGTIDLGHLPDNLRLVQIRGQQFTGVENICNLPQSLEKMTICAPNIENKTIRIGSLPGNPRLVIDISGCGFTQVEYNNPSDSDKVCA